MTAKQIAVQVFENIIVTKHRIKHNISGLLM